MYKNFIYSIALLFSITIGAQEIEKKWQLSNSQKDYLELKGGTYELNISIDSLNQKGDYLIQDNFIFLFENGADSPTKRFVIETKTDSTLTLKNKGKAYSFLASNKPTKTAVINGEIKPNEGFSLNSMLRGILGMISLLAIAYLFSSNKKGINWKTVFIGLAVQLILAIGVLKVGFVKTGFEFVGGLFVKVLDFTRAGSEFLLGGMMNVDNFGFIFLFQVLPQLFSFRH
jgi:CNT family concentrative nucleoside transporter